MVQISTENNDLLMVQCLFDEDSDNTNPFIVVGKTN